jgi:DNA recombination protein RmuC
MNITLVLMLLPGIAIGWLIGWLRGKTQLADAVRLAEAKTGELKEEYIAYKAKAEAESKYLLQSMTAQTKEMDRLNQKFTTEFENVANRILETKSERFTQLNKVNLNAILEPLGRTISEFKEQVSTVYDKESKERFSLSEKVKELAELNHLLSQEAKNLTRALKTESKTQGRWGEVILESILEKSGLRKGEEYFMEYQLFDADGRALRNEARGTKMRPDAIVKYPDNRHVIIDAKVSLNAFIRATEEAEAAAQQTELATHVQAIKTHIQQLGARAYDDYDKTLDFVMLFIPSEAAYIAALQVDPNLWNFAYDRRILLISPSNLIISLKLIVDLWKREYQNQNAQAIADRGSKLYDKFVGFVSNLQNVGNALDSARSSYDDAFKQLSTGRDNLVAQAIKLKGLGVKTKSELPGSMIPGALSTDDPAPTHDPAPTDDPGIPSDDQA